MICVSPSELKIILDIFKKHIPRGEVRAFGSRYKWTCKDYSDLDIAINIGRPMTSEELGAIEEDFIESDLPYRVDVLDYNGISKEFRAVIDKGYEVVYKALGWEKVRLGDVCDIKHGYAFKGDFFSDIETNSILITPGNFAIGGGFKSEKLKYYNGEFALEYVLKSNDVIVTMTDLSKMSDTLGYSALVPNNINKRYLHNQRIGLLINISATCDKNYLYWLMRTHNYQRFIAGTASGTTVKHTSPSTIKNYSFLLPPLPEQKRIANILSSLDDKIELNNRINKNLEAQAQAIFKSWFVDFEPFLEGEFEDSELGRIPKGWRVGTLLDIADDIVCGKTPSTKIKGNFGKDMPFITIPDMHGCTYITKTERSLSKFGANSQAKKTVPMNSICVSCIATAGLVALTAIPSQTNQQINTIVCKETISNFYVYSLMCSMSEKIKMLGSSGSATNNLNKRQFSKIEIIIPPKIALDKFSLVVTPLFEKIKHNQHVSEQIINLRNELLPKLMNGELLPVALQNLEDSPPPVSSETPPSEREAGLYFAQHLK